MFFGPKFTNQQLDALAKSIMDFNELGDAAILRARLLDNPMEEIPITDEYLPIGMFMSKEKKKKVLARHSFNMGVITGFAFQFVDYAKGQEKYIDDIDKQALLETFDINNLYDKLITILEIETFEKTNQKKVN